MAWRRSGVQFPLAPRNAAGHQPAVLSFSVLTLSGSNAGSNQQPLKGPPFGELGDWFLGVHFDKRRSPQVGAAEVCGLLRRKCICDRLWCRPFSGVFR